MSCQPFCQLFCKVPSFLDAPTNASCLPPNGPFSVLCRRSRKYGYLFSSHASGCSLDRPLLLLAPSSAPKSQSPLLYRRTFRVSHPHCNYHLPFRNLQTVRCSSRSAWHRVSLKEENEFCYSVDSILGSSFCTHLPLVFIPSHSADNHELTRSL